ncbi:ECF transporter S component [Sedimentibacter sp. zth1]|uniref:ECF transporter S component n=1 Tax=Sedimentibacter sp. zth1 TaxID=2816908 RepID=UPI001A9393E4|nr:ECF transporter S component [Sedimentibacter sp. zth1]QSX06179.1 ECF transporter S component [Sedimentibacter sp. zth1]
MQNKNSLKDLILTGLFIAIGLTLPIVFHYFGGLGAIFLPMHIPVLLCGFICGWKYGLICGIITPLLSSVLTGMPPIFPIGASMSFELLTYGLLCGLLYKTLHKNIYVSLISAMLGGRIVSGIANTIFMGVAGKPYGFSIFITSAFIKSLPGIIIQIILIPLLIIALQKTGQLKTQTQR